MTAPAGSIDRAIPHSIEAEQSVLGALIIDRDAIVEVAELLQPADFYRPTHGAVFTACLALYAKREPIDPVTLSTELEHTGDLEPVGGSAYLTGLIGLTPTSVNAVYYAGIVREKSLQRGLIGAAGKIAGLGYDAPNGVARAVDEAEQILFAVGQQRITSGFTQLRSLLSSAYDRLDYLYQHKGEISGITTGIPALDSMTTGLQKGDLVLLAARPSVGKTSLALNIAEHAAIVAGKTVGLFSLEMSKEQLVLRLLSSVSNVDSQRLRTGFLEDMDFTRLAPAMNSLAQAAIYIDDTPNVSSMELRAKARRLQAEAGLDLVIVDYLQLMKTSTPRRDGNRVQEVSEISAGLKTLARELNVPVLALSQLSRQTEMRESKEPRLSDLRESGSLEQDADVVMFLWREEERGRDTENGEGEVVNLAVAKQRNGPTGRMRLWFSKRQTRFAAITNEERFG